MVTDFEDAEIKNQMKDEDKTKDINFLLDSRPALKPAYDKWKEKQDSRKRKRDKILEEDPQPKTRIYNKNFKGGKNKSNTTYRGLNYSLRVVGMQA